MTEKVKQHAAPVTGSDEIDIGRLVGTVIEARWWVIGITAVFALCAVVYTFFATPIYSADALVQIEQNSGNSLVQDIGSALANKPPASDAEIQLIRSRLVLGKTVDDLDLDIAVSKNTFPIFGAGWDRLMGRQNETVKVNTFNRPKEMADQVFTGSVAGCGVSALSGLRSWFACRMRRERRSDKMRQHRIRQRMSLFRIRLIFVFVIAIILIRAGAAEDGVQNHPFHRNTVLLKAAQTGFHFFQCVDRITRHH